MIVTVTSTLPARTGGFVWFAFDVPSCQSLTAIHDALAELSILQGDRIDTEVTSGVRRIVRRTPCILTLQAIGMITPLHTELVDENGAVIA